MSNKLGEHCTKCGRSIHDEEFVEGWQVVDLKLLCPKCVQNKSVDELTYDEVCKMLFDNDNKLKCAAMKTITLDLVTEATFSILFEAFNILATEDIHTRGTAAFRAALIEKYRTTLERAMND